MRYEGISIDSSGGIRGLFRGDPWPLERTRKWRTGISFATGFPKGIAEDEPYCDIIEGIERFVSG